MITEVEILQERLETYQGKRGQVEQWRVTCLDRTPDNNALRNTFDYTLSDEERKAHAGKLLGKRITLALHDIRAAFGGRFEFMGRIVKA